MFGQYLHATHGEVDVGAVAGMFDDDFFLLFYHRSRSPHIYRTIDLFFNTDGIMDCYGIYFHNHHRRDFFRFHAKRNQARVGVVTFIMQHYFRTVHPRLIGNVRFLIVDAGQRVVAFAQYYIRRTLFNSAVHFAQCFAAAVHQVALRTVEHDGGKHQGIRTVAQPRVQVDGAVRGKSYLVQIYIHVQHHTGVLTFEAVEQCTDYLKGGVFGLQRHPQRLKEHR